MSHSQPPQGGGVPLPHPQGADPHPHGAPHPQGAAPAEVAAEPGAVMYRVVMMLPFTSQDTVNQLRNTPPGVPFPLGSRPRR